MILIQAVLLLLFLFFELISD